MKLLAILIAIVYFHSSKAFDNFNIISVLNPLKSFDLRNVSTFLGFDAFRFDGQLFNPFQYELDNVFDRFTKKFNTSYTAAERAQRRENLRKSIESIAKFVNDSNVRKPSFQVGLNWLSDKSPEEFKKLLGNREVLNRTVNLSERPKRSTIDNAICQPKTTSALPASFDWRSQNIVTPVKNQKSCGCCWAFASTASIESQWAKKTTKIIDLSEQDLVNCASTRGCNGDSMDTAYNFVISNGQANETSAPYTATVGQCKHYPLVNGVKISDYCRKGGTTHWTMSYSNGTTKSWDSTEDNPDPKIMRDIYEIGPVVGAMNADSLSNYASGIYDVPNCSNNTNHAITLIGWGTQSGVDFWIVKNSWGNTWGESGYFRMVRGKNMCGINNIYYYPILTSSTLFSKAS